MRKNITKEQYELALERVENLLPLVDDNTSVTDKRAVELALMSDIVIEYEKAHFPISKPTVAELLELSLEDRGISKKDFAKEIGVSPSRVSDYLSGRSEPTLKIARMICKVLNISPAVILGV
ncbi:helix-turn-helix domain-containing protein [Parabacteroides sp.]